MRLFYGSRDSAHHIIKFRTAICGKALRMCLLEKPQLLKSDDCIATGNFEVELQARLAALTYVYTSRTYYLLKLFQVKDIRFLRMRPAQERGKVDKCSRKYPLMVLE